MLKIFNLRSKMPNIGNELIALGMATGLQNAFARGVNLVTIPSMNGDSARGGGLTNRTIYDMNRLADGLIIGPGNLLENGGMQIDLNALKALQVPCMMFSVSYGRIFSQQGELIKRTDSMPEQSVKALFQSSTSVLLRDNATQAYINSLGLENGIVGSCPSLFLGDKNLLLPAADPEIKDSVLISIRNPKLMSIPYSLQGRLQHEITKIIDYYRNHEKAKVFLLCHDYQDLSFAASFGDVPVLYTEDPYVFLSWLRNCKLNLTFRLHAFLACLALGSFSIPISYDERSMSLVETIGLSAWTIDLFKEDNLLEAIKNRGNNLKSFFELKEQAKPVINKFCNLMNSQMEEFASSCQRYHDSKKFI